MNTRDLVEYALWAQKRFSDIYNNSGLISISETGVQVTEQEFKRIVDTHSTTYTIEKHGGSQNWFIANTVIQGVDIFTLGSKQEFQDAGLEW